MRVIEFLRLIRKHLVILVAMPLLLAAIVIFLTRHQKYTYTSETTLFTGIASGMSIDFEKNLSFFATNTAFDNLINVVKSRETQQETAIRLLAQHLMLPKADPRFISYNAYTYLHRITPKYVFDCIAKADSIGKPNNPSVNAPNTTTLENTGDKNLSRGEINQSSPDSSTSLSVLMSTVDPDLSSQRFPESIDHKAFDQTVENLKKLLASSDTNFVANLLNFDNPHYSIKAISSVMITRIASSDLVKLQYTSDDPGICQQTLIFLTDGTILNYKLLKENRSDAIVRYFEIQVKKAISKLNGNEDLLLKFNKDNRIINYYEQSKAVALAKEALDVDLNNMKIKLAGTQAALDRLQDKLSNQQKVQLASTPILEKRTLLSQINTKIATAEIMGVNDTKELEKLAEFKVQAAKLKDEIKSAVGDLYTFGNTTEGLPLSSLLNDWISNVITFEETKAGLGVMQKRIEEFQKQYDIYAPAGANLKRIEREINVSEQEFLELLHGLNLAKLKMQDIQYSSNLKPVDEPYYPITPNPNKRKLIIIAAWLAGFILILATILAMEFFDDTLKNHERASKKLKLSSIGSFPKVYLKPQIENFPEATSRLVEMISEQIELLKRDRIDNSQPFTTLFFSTSQFEGKTILMNNLIKELVRSGKNVVGLSIKQVLKAQGVDNLSKSSSHSSLSKTERPKARQFSFLNRLLGYHDPRVDYNSPFLDQREDISNDQFLHLSLNVSDAVYRTATVEQLLAMNAKSLPPDCEYIFVEIPAILYSPIPSGLVAESDLAVLVCRANRLWSTADNGMLENFKKQTDKIRYALNGVELDVMEATLGELSKRRSQFRIWMKKLIRFQFLSSDIL